ncbi:MAG: hypothetical protein HQK83_06130 [Fibrobacteria bacterium]|nr:hypothetical protein [Fibrobacteria bacterium]
MVDKALLEILCCPETKEDVSLAVKELIDTINTKITAGEIKNRGGNPVEEKIEAGLVRQDNKYLYPIRQDIPIMLIDEAIPLEGLV